MEKKIKSKGLIITYAPRIKEFTIISGEKFLFNENTKNFEMDVNPYGDAICTPISNIIVNKNRFEFDINENTKKIHYVITSKYKADEYVYELISEFGNNFSYQPNETDKITVEFENNILKTIDLIKYENDNISNSLMIVFENDHVYLIKYPFERIDVKSIELDQSSIICRTSDEILKWGVLIQERVYQYFIKIIKGGLYS